MKTLIPSLIFLLVGFNINSQEVKTNTETGNIIKIANFKIPQLNRETTLIIYLPKSYSEKNTTRFPVLYMTDGQNLFNSATAYKEEWKIDEYLEQNDPTAKARELIVVGIYNSQFREKEYIFWDYLDSKKNLVKVEGFQYSKFLAETLKPYIDMNYRTQSDFENTGIGGSSYGACVAINTALLYPNTYGRIAAFSFSWPEMINPKEADLFFEKNLGTVYSSPNQKWYIDITKNETGSRSIAQNYINGLLEWLQFEGANLSNIKTYIDLVGSHDELTWSKNFPSAISWLFGIN